MNSSSVVAPNLVFGLLKDVTERAEAAYAKQDPTFVLQLQNWLLASPERRAMFAEGREFKEATVIPIDRSKPFDPTTFPRPGERWRIAEQDERALALNEVTLDSIQLLRMLEQGEFFVNGEDKLERLKKAGHIRLDAKVFQTLWENQTLIPARWKEKTNGAATFIYFDGTILLDPSGLRYVLSFCWRDGEWHQYFSWLDNALGVSSRSAVVPAS